MNSFGQSWCFLRLGLAALAFLFTTSVRAQDRRILHGHIPRAVTNLHLQSIGRLPSSSRLNLAIGLPLRNPEALANLLQGIYDPANPRYRHYLTTEEFTEMFGPTEQDYQAVINFAEANGLTVTITHPNRMLLDVEGSVADIEKAFRVTLQVYRHPKEPRMFRAPDIEPSVPSGLKILDVSGLNNYARPRPNSHIVKLTTQTSNPIPNAGSVASTSDMIFRAAYVRARPSGSSGQSVALVQFDGYYTNDIASYVNQAGLPTVTLTNILLDGFSGAAGANNGEVALDIEMVISMAPGIAKVMLYEGNPNNFIPNDVLNRMATDNQARQISCSWGWIGGPNATTDQIFQQMAAQGQSFFVASGDSDAYQLNCRRFG